MDSPTAPTPTANGKKRKVTKAKPTKAQQSSVAPQTGPSFTPWTSGKVFVPLAGGSNLLGVGGVGAPAPIASSSTNVKISNAKKAPAPVKPKKTVPRTLASQSSIDQTIDMVARGNYMPSPSFGSTAQLSSVATTTVPWTSTTSGLTTPMSSANNQLNQYQSVWSSMYGYAMPTNTAGVPASAASSSSAYGYNFGALPNSFTGYQPPPTLAVAANNAATSAYLGAANSTANLNFGQTLNVLSPPPLLATPAMPPDWMKNYYDASLSLNPFQEFPVDPQSLEFKTIAELLGPTQVISAEKVVNPDLWQRYCNTRKDMIRTKTDDLALLSKLGLDESEVIRCSHHALNFDRDPLLETDAGKYTPKEVLLFHCTRNMQNLDKILRQGLDERLSSATGGLLGKGIYFADNPEKSIQYDGGAGVILIFAVLLGDCLCVDHIARAGQFVREPEKENVQKRNFNDQFFDSITSRPASTYNEYVIYNRNQCCPLYKVKYQRPSAPMTGVPRGNSASYDGDNYTKSRSATPPFAWKKLPGQQTPMPNNAFDGTWPFFAFSVFEKMGVVPAPDPPQPESQIMGEDNSYIVDVEELEGDTAVINDQLAALVNLGFFDDLKNREALKRYNNNLENAANFLLDSETPPLPQPTTSAASSRTNGKLTSAPVTTIDLTTSDSNPEPDSTSENKSLTRPAPVLPELEECSICCIEYDSFSRSPLLWKKLKCGHKLCVSCFQSIETSGTSMAGVRHISIRCPFCQGIVGIEVGTCPNGKMNVTLNPASCVGYPGFGSIQINYVISGTHSLNRIAYLPNNSEGNEVLKLLQTAWDRRLCFTIGTSNTTGEQNVLVWNIHHKTDLGGGVQAHGYPDPGYLARVKGELNAYGIE